MENVRVIIDNVVDAETADSAARVIPELEHALTSKKEASALLKAKTDSLNLKYSKEEGCYVPREG